MHGRLITFSNLFPSAAFPAHGTFVEDRMRRVVARTGLDWEVVSPVPRAPWPLRRGEYARLAAQPAVELVNGVRVHHPRYFHLPGLSSARQAARMEHGAHHVVSELARVRPCVIDAHYVYPDGVAALCIARALGVPCLVTARGTDLNVLAEHPRIARQIRAAAAGAFALLAVSRPLCERLAAVTGRPVELARNGVDLEVFTVGERGAARRRLGLPPEGQLVLGVGRLVPGKGFLQLAQALRQLPETRLVLVGDGPERARLAAALPPARVILLGARARAEVVQAYQACDVLALPSEREGWPNVVTEALACGLPVVATDVGAVPEILADARYGAVVARGDEGALVAGLERFLDHPPDPAAVREYASRFGWAETVELLAGLLERALG
jgi:glycosyltransferase involved in cell wall biosynthesis